MIPARMKAATAMNDALRTNDPAGFVPPPYPYDRLDRLAPFAKALDGGVVDLSIGTPCDPPPPAVIEALGHSNAERGYPASIGSEPLRTAIRGWLSRRFDLDVPLSQIAACVGKIGRASCRERV